MGKFYSNISHMGINFLVLSLQFVAIFGSPIEFLPGFHGPLPFYLQTGYVGVGEEEIFYYFVESEKNPEEDPLLLWSTGGPGCSAATAFFYEIGPVQFQENKHQGRLPSLVLNPFSWSKVANILFVDFPVGVGFSYATTPRPSLTGDFKSSADLNKFLRKSLKRSCKENYTIVDPANIDCLEGLQVYSELIKGIEPAMIRENKCGTDYEWPYNETAGEGRRYMLYEDVASSNLLPSYSDICHVEGYLLSRYYLNDDNVRKALHIQKGSIGQWVRCKVGKQLKYTREINNSVPYHATLIAKGYRSLIYSGDHDFMVPFISTQAWIQSLGYPVVDDWRPWWVDDQVGGYTRTYANRMTFATIKGGGHVAPEYRPKECYFMFAR